MATPPFSDGDLKAARSLLQSGKVGQVLFSEGTYQIEVKDPKTKTSFWPFLQLNDEGEIQDRFCTCKTAEKRGSCPHLAAAYLQIFNEKSDPLHVRFRASLWNQLCLIASHRHGYETSALKKQSDGTFTASSVTTKRLFFVKGLNPKGKKRLDEILFKRPTETEETSLKFSNLPPEELLLWKEGRPSEQLRYELSFWSDLGKWWMLLQEEGLDYQIDFIFGDEELPKWIEVRFSQVSFGFYIAEVNWANIIPTLTTVQSPLPIFEFSQQMIQKIVYDPVAKQMSLEFSGTLPPIEEVKGIPMGEWIFLPGRGFYSARIDPLMHEGVITENRIASFLHKHPKLVEKHLAGVKMHRGKISPHYDLFFDAEANLHIRPYLFEVGDMQKPLSAAFGPWVFVEDKGFFLLEDPLFEGIEKIIPKNKVGEFINRHRHWLQGIEGFQVHISGVVSRLTYTFDPLAGITFQSRFQLAEERDLLDLGDWLYIKGSGLYPKMGDKMGGVLQAGYTVSIHDISRFIHAHHEELEQVERFFSNVCPVQKSGLVITLDSEQRIHVHPEFQLLPGYTTQQVHLFGDIAYVEGEGFSEIPPDCRLPDNFQREKIIEKNAEPYFVFFELEQLRNFILSIDPSLMKPRNLHLLINKIKRDEKSKAGGWLIDFNYQSEIGSIDTFAVWKALHENKTYIFSSAGLILLKQPRFNWLKSISKRRWLKEGKQIRLTTLEWLRLCVFEEILLPTGTNKDARESRQTLEALLSFTSPKPFNLEGLKSDLRPYQLKGLEWLWFLYCYDLSGLLCDEMGLGKTHQAMALLAAVYNATKDRGCKFLVVCPTSVIYHWEDLLNRFFPSLRVLVFYGLQRTLENFETNADILLTSYGTLRSEKEALSRYVFEVAIYDEIQIAKNAASQTHRALRTMQAKMRLGLTGTPIENRLLELKSLFDLVLPTYLPQESLFRELFVQPIEKNQDPEKKALLSRLVRPFILRRRKAEVLLELPEKIEEISYCGLSDEQKDLYRTVVQTRKEALIKQLADENEPIPYVHIFSLLSSLKQICDHPCLYNKTPQDWKKHSSGKWDLFVELLHETRDSGQKLVVFSQYLFMLDIIEAYLTEQNIGFAGIRGSTRDRKSEIDRFREDPSCEVFVASLQAAGVGIDLVAASVVIHYDRWWNPAKENQATDRVHRIGQRRGVQVFKLVTKGTIEEQIHRIIERKLTLMEGVIGFDDQDQIKGLDRKELIDLLKQMENIDNH